MERVVQMRTPKRNPTNFEAQKLVMSRQPAMDPVISLPSVQRQYSSLKV